MIPFLASAQRQSFLSNPISPNARLLSIGDTTILVNQMDLKNEAHKWTTYDCAVNVLAIKKLITPAEGNMLGQTGQLPSGESMRFVKIKPVDEGYSFATYIPGNGEYSLLHYVVSSLEKAFVNNTSINLQGKLTEKKVFEERHKILLPAIM